MLLLCCSRFNTQRQHFWCNKWSRELLEFIWKQQVHTGNVNSPRCRQFAVVRVDGCTIGGRCRPRGISRAAVRHVCTPCMLSIAWFILESYFWGNCWHSCIVSGVLEQWQPHTTDECHVSLRPRIRIGHRPCPLVPTIASTARACSPVACV